MKKTIYLIFSFISLMFVIGCSKLNLEDYIIESKPVLSSGDTYERITKDITFLEFAPSNNKIKVSYEFIDSEFLSKDGKVTRSRENDVTILITMTLTYKKDSLNDSFSITIKKDDSILGYDGIYSSINGLNKDELKAELSRIINANMRLNTYGDARDILQITDQDPNNQNNVLTIYDRRSVKGTWDSGTTWDREHVWPQSYLGASANNGSKNVASDLHNLRVATPSVNNQRSNRIFVYKKPGSEFGIEGSGWYPGDSDKGDIARMMFYMNTAWDLHLINVGSAETFLRWHSEDPVDDFERNRNEKIAYYQGNSNPYIDHEELVYYVYGTVETVNNESNEIIIIAIAYIDDKKNRYYKA